MATPRIDNLEKNLLHNSNFDIWQRGTSITFPAGALYTSDRWKVFMNGTYVSQAIVTRDTDVPTLVQSGFQSQYSWKITKSTSAINPAATDYLFVSQKVEGLDYQKIHGAKKVRLQFWVKSSVAGIFSGFLSNSASNRTLPYEYTIAQVNTWEKKTLDLTTDNTGTWLFDNGTGVEIAWTFAAGSTYRGTAGTWAGTIYFGGTNQTAAWSNTTSASTFFISQVMLIPQDFTLAGASSVDVNYSRASIQDEWSKCLRYYHRPAWDSASGNHPFVVLQAISGTLGIGPYRLPVTMRTNPTLGRGGTCALTNSTASNQALTNLTIDVVGVDVVRLAATVASGLTAGNATLLQKSATSTDYIDFSADL